MKEKICAKLIELYWAEIETIQNYIANSTNLDGVRAEEIKKALAVDIPTELTHAQTLAKRIKELDGLVPGSSEFRATQTSLQPKPDTTDVVSVIKGVIDAETAAVAGYNELIRLCEGTDYVTQDLAIRTLADEESHLIEFKGFLKEYIK
ncbi:MAG: ferritin-like domain-containing protein [Ignavibacteria bacterium]